MAVPPSNSSPKQVNSGGESPPSNVTGNGTGTTSCSSSDSSNTNLGHEHYNSNGKPVVSTATSVGRLNLKSSPSEQAFASESVSNGATEPSAAATTTTTAVAAVADAKDPGPTPEAAAIKKEPKSAATIAALKPNLSIKTEMLTTYESSEESESYQTALSLMKQGEFDHAIEWAEAGMEELRSIFHLSAQTSRESEDKGGINPQSENIDFELHPSMAPFYYLYGTTLLYKIEEQQDLTHGTATNVRVYRDPYIEGKEETFPVCTTATATAGGFAGASSSAVAEVVESEDEDSKSRESEPVEDVQIAWEFLEMARSILTTMIETDTSNDKFRSDLAQVHLREGDLSRMNGQNQSAVEDYQTSLRYFRNNSRVGPYDRKIADLHYNIGLLLTTEAARANISAALPPSVTPDPVLAMFQQMISSPQKTSASPKTLSPRAKLLLRNRGVYHFWQCCLVLAGHIASACDMVDPLGIVREVEQSVPNFKSVRCHQDDTEASDKISFDEDQADDPVLVCRKLTYLRALLVRRFPVNANEQQQALFKELMQIMEEIHETIDEVEQSEEAVNEVVGMKADITAAVAAAAAHDEETGFGSASAAATTAEAQPIMAIRKKNKRDAREANLYDSA